MSTISPNLRSVLSRPPLAHSYAAAVALALLALCPFIVLTTATSLFQEDLVRDLGTSPFMIQLTAGLANATYAFGAVAAADLIQRIQPRRLYLACEALFLAGSVLALISPGGIVAFSIGRIVQGLATGMLLVCALPPLVTNHGSERLPSTAAFINLGLFGMVTLGPLVGGLAGSFHGWRVLFIVVSALSAIALVVGALGFEPRDPADPDMPFDWSAMPLALAATVLPFFGVAWLTKTSFTSPVFLAPVAVGIALIVVLIVVQYRKRDSLMPVRPIAHTLPVVGTAGAMVVGAAFTTLIELAELYLMDVDHHSPVMIGTLVAAQLAGVAVATWLFKRALPTRWTPILALSGLLSIVAGAALMLALSPAGAEIVVPFAALLLGFGAGAGVAPGLFMAGLSVPSAKIGRTFALVELLRSEAAFLIGPVLLQIAMASASLAGGVQLAVTITLALVAVAGLALVGLYLLGGARPHAPDLDGWLNGDATAYDSPRVAAVLRD